MYVIKRSQLAAQKMEGVTERPAWVRGEKVGGRRGGRGGPAAAQAVSVVGMMSEHGEITRSCHLYTPCVGTHLDHCVSPLQLHPTLSSRVEMTGSLEQPRSGEEGCAPVASAPAVREEM